MKTRAWKDIKDEHLSPEAQAEVKGRVDREILEMNLGELRKRRAGLTQVQVADLLGVTQAAISQLEKREDALLSNLAEYVKALGGELELVVHFENHEDVRVLVQLPQMPRYHETVLRDGLMKKLRREYGEPPPRKPDPEPDKDPDPDRDPDQDPKKDAGA